MITFTEAQELCKQGNVIPLFEKIPADLDTPVSAFIKLASTKKQSFLLESIEGGEKLARYSFLGFDPLLTIESDGKDSLTISNKKKTKISLSPVNYLRDLFRSYCPVNVTGLPRFTGGAVGYFAYDTVRWIEAVPDKHKDTIG
ncbi:MAG: anthranilate synthase component I, partial [Candidatus Zixiibacteriota bacterium]